MLPAPRRGHPHQRGLGATSSMKPEETSSRFDFSAHGRCRYNVGRIEQHSDARGCKHQLTQRSPSRFGIPRTYSASNFGSTTPLANQMIALNQSANTCTAASVVTARAKASSKMVCSTANLVANVSVGMVRCPAPPASKAGKGHRRQRSTRRRNSIAMPAKDFRFTPRKRRETLHTRATRAGFGVRFR